MKWFYLILLIACLTTDPLRAQSPADVLSEVSLRKDISFLAADSLKGRGNFTRSIVQAGAYISEQFSHAGLSYFPGNNEYEQSFLFTTNSTPFGRKESVKVDGRMLRIDDYVYLSTFEIPVPFSLNICTRKNLAPQSKQELINNINSIGKYNAGPVLIVLPYSLHHLVEELEANDPGLVRPLNGSILVLAPEEPLQSVEVDILPAIKRLVMTNIVGVLPGKSKPEELIFITSHYDHLGVIHGTKDSIMNGANDNASGTAAVLALARYFGARADNERTLVFVAFAGEELGLLGSKYLVPMLDASKVVADFNLEMLGRPMKNNRGKLLFTGEESRVLADIIQKYTTSIKLLADPFPEQELYRRSDHYLFALQNIPAATFMCFSPNDPYYHKPGDEISTLDLAHMSLLLKGLVPGIAAIANGKETPVR